MTRVRILDDLDFTGRGGLLYADLNGPLADGRIVETRASSPR
jgi:hypothetical protein